MKKHSLLGIMIFTMISLVHGQLVTENFETGFINFKNSIRNTNQFVRDSNIYHSGAKSAHDQYIDYSSDTLYQTNTIDLTTTTSPELIFWQICKTEGGYDKGYIYISTDSGLTYNVLPSSSYLGNSAGADGYALSGYFHEDSYSTWGTESTDTVKNTWWKRESFDLSAYSTFNNVKIIFVLTSDGSIQREGWYLDDISIENVSCPAVTGITNFGTTSDSTNITWTPSASDSLWQVEYDLIGFSLGTGTRTSFSANDSVGLNALISNTGYNFYVRSICKSGDTSDWIGAGTFFTNCVTLTAPYSQNFDLMTPGTASTGYSCYAVEDLSDCWSNDLSAFNMWAVHTGSSSYFATGPTTDHTISAAGTGNYMFLTTYNCYANTSTAYSPIIDISNLANPELSFYYHMYGASMGSLDVYVSNDNGMTWSASLFSKSGDQTDAWKEGVISLTSYIGDTIQIKFEGVSGLSYTSDIAIDDILVDDVPTCPKPTALSNYSLFPDSVNLTWVNGTNDSTWILEYGVSGFTVGTGTSINSSNDSISIGALTPNTSYDVFLRSFCNVSDTSLWIGPFTFTTPCLGFTPPYFEDFSTMDYYSPPTCWDEATGILTVQSTLAMGTSLWGSRTSFANDGVSSSAAAMGNYANITNEWLISPIFDLGSGSTPYQLEFDIAITDYYNSSAPSITGKMGSDDKFVLLISTDNGFTWSDTNILVQWDTANMPSSSGEYFHYNLTTAGYTGNVRFGLYSESTIANEDYDIHIDNFAVVQVPSCPRPLQLIFDSATMTSASISWTNGVADSSWILEYGAPGFAQGSGTIINSSTNPATISGLTGSSCYDVYLRSICSIGDTSVVIGPLNFCTECAPVIDLCEDFEFYSTSELPVCWSNFVSSTSASTNVGVRTFSAYSGSNTMYFTNSNDPSATVLLTTPEMTAITAGTHRANFWMKGDSTVIIGTISDPSNPGTFTPLDTIIPTSSYVNYHIPFDTYGGTNQHIAFLWNPSNSYEDLYIDEFCFEIIPSCEKAPSVAILNEGVDSASLSLGWNADTSHVSYLIQYGPAGYDPISNPAGGVTTTSNSNFVAINGLSSLAEYCFWIKSICTSGDTSFWEGPICGFTGCPSSTPIPYFQNFNNYNPSGTPTCWEEGTGMLTTSGSTLAMGTSSWSTDGFANAGTTGAASINLYSTNKYEWLISPSINLGTDPNRYHIIEFDIALTDYFNTTPGVVGDDDTIALVISYDNGATWSNTNIIELFDTSNVPSNTGDHIVYTLRNKSGVVKFGFYAASSVSNEDNDWFIDNFSIKDTVFVGIEEISQKNNFRIYPNPNSGIFTILNEGTAQKSNVKLMDIQGRIVFDSQYYFNNNASKRIEIENLNNGVYILLLQNEGKIEQHRLIINK